MKKEERRKRGREERGEKGKRREKKILRGVAALRAEGAQSCAPQVHILRRSRNNSAPKARSIGQVDVGRKNNLGGGTHTTIKYQYLCTYV